MSDPTAPPAPSDDCLVCRTPLSGALGSLGRVAGIRRSNQNPNLCNRCDVHVADGSIVEVGVLFADLTGYTPLVNQLGPERTHELVDAFLRSAKEAVVKWDGFVVQFAGDEIMALFNVPLNREDFARRAVSAASEIQQKMPELSERLGAPLRTTVGVGAGFARVGRLGSNDIKDYTAIGDVVNRTARLVSRADPGDILVDSDVYSRVQPDFPDAPTEAVSLKGFENPVEVTSLGTGHIPNGPAQPTLPTARGFRLGLLLAAILGAPCAGLLLLGPLAAAAGISAVGFTGAAIYLDQTAIRLPLLSIAATAAVTNLAIIFWPRRSSGAFEVQAGASGVVAQWGLGRVGRIGIVISALALSAIALEIVAHQIMHG